MNRRISLATVAAAAGGLLSAAFLQAAVAVSDTGDTDTFVGFTVGDLTFNDPVATFLGTTTPGYQALDPLFANAPLLSLGTDDALIVSLGSQGFTVEDSDGTTLGTIATSVNVQNLLGINSAQFTVTDADAADGLTSAEAAELPVAGTVYSITNIGGGFANVYAAVPNADGTGAATITDTLVTPFGNFDLPTSFDAIAPLDGGAPFEALGAASGVDGVSDNAFTIGDTTFDPGSDGFNPVTYSLGGIAPLLRIGAGTVSLSATLPPPASQEFEVYTDGTDAGTVYGSVDASDILGIDSTQFTVQAVTPTSDVVANALSNSDIDFSNADFTASDLANALVTAPFGEVVSEPAYMPLDFTGGVTAREVTTQLGRNEFELGDSGISTSDIASALDTVSTADLPTDGTVYSVTDLGGGFANVYQAIPGTDGGAATISDTFVTPFGSFDVPTAYDATAPLDPAAPLGALAAASGNADLSDNAFTIDGTTFDPGADGFTALPPLFGIAPLLEIAGANLVGSPLFSERGVDIFDSNGDALGTVNLGENLSNILGIHTSQFFVTGVEAADGLSDAQTAELPVQGTVYSITQIGGFTNVYEAIPNADGTAASSITDTLITPFGSYDLSSLFGGIDAIAPLDVGDAVEGVNAGSGAAADALANGFDLFDPSTWF